MKNILVYGCGGVGCELIDLVSSRKPDVYTAFIDDNPQLHMCFGFEVLTLDKVLNELETTRACLKNKGSCAILTKS